MRSHRRRRATGTMLVAALVTAIVTALLPASPALALPSGSGWSASWSYYQPTAYRYAGTLPGVRLTGYATDDSGTSSTAGTIEDTADDARCARVMLYAYGVGYVADRTTCGNGSYLTYSTGSFSQGLLVIVYRMVPGTTTQDKGFYLYIPGSATDPELRTVGTGASWSYYTSTSFQYAVTRPGVRLTGYGAHQSGDLRSALNTVQKTATSVGCATGSVTGGVTTSGGTCANGGSTSFGRFDLSNNFEASACYQPVPGTRRCLPLNIPEPW
ncbi:hypothetical protein ACGFJ5_09285 [Micromonospora echinaurantiaca]|uniref:hypothetical protein n=1 Tax=Micromonospora echinaurantiaca TaxID=47857 RepID=UPI003721C52B